MGDLSARTSHTPSRPRPLGQVKTESLHFHTGSGGSRPSPLLSAYPDLRDLCDGDGGFRVSLRSMRELRESLRHAALLNIVAAANADQPQAEGDNRLAKTPVTSASHHLHSPYHQQRGSSSTPLALSVTSSRSSPHPGDGGGGRAAGSSHFHHSHRDGAQGGSLTPHNLVANFLSPRMRTISIPKPRAHDLPEPFIHKSVTQAKENLSKVGEMARARAEGEEGETKTGGVSTAPANATSGLHDTWKSGVASSGAGLVLPLRGHSLDPKHNQHNSHQDRAREAASANLSSAMSRDTSITILLASSATASTNNPPSASGASERSSATTETTLSTRTGSKKATNKMKDDARGSQAQQMLSLRRHLTPSKKRELVKRLTEIAKCEAVDMSDPMTTDDDAELRFVSPMIILSQQRHEIRHPEDSLPVSNTHNDSTPTENGETDVERNNTLQRAKSLSSLNGPHSYQHYKLTSRNKKPSGAASLENEPRSLTHAHSGSMPDLTAQEADGYATDQQDGEEADGAEWNSESLFTDGIIGRTIRRDGTGLGIPLESRPLLPTTPSLRARRGARPTGRRSSLGLRDRGPNETQVSGVASLTTSTTRGTMNGTSDPSSGGAVLDVSMSYTQILPTLTITGLSTRDKPPYGVTNSRTAREMRPTSQLSMSSSQKLFQQLDDQCEKLQRQLNITLNVPRRGLHWQHGATSSTLPISRSDVTAHLQCVALTESTGRAGVKDSPTNHGRRSQHLTTHGPLTALSDVDEHSMVGGAGGEEKSEKPSFSPDNDNVHQNTDHVLGHFAQFAHEENPQQNRKTSLSSKHSFSSSLDGPPLLVNLDSALDSDPVLQGGLKEPRYQGFSSRVGENEGRSRFHYVNTSRTDTEEAREMKYRVLKALDQDVYYDFQHRKYRNTTNTPVAKLNDEEDRPRVHFYKVKVNGDT